MKRKSVFILEDDNVLRMSLEESLLNAGFDVVAARNLTEARQVLAKHGDIDVVLLDIRIVVEGGGVENGLEFGLELKSERRQSPPEFLVLTVYDEKREYYQLAMRLGVADYLQKTQLDIKVLTQHIRALALRRALRGRPSMTEKLSAIAESSSSRNEAISRFCREILVGEIRDVFGGGFILFVSDGEKVVWFEAIPDSHDEVVEHVEAAVNSRFTQVARLEDRKDELFRDLGVADLAMSQEFVDKIEGMTFICLAETKNLRVSLGLLRDPRKPEDTTGQAALLDRYLQREVIANLFQIMEIWTDLELKRKLETQKRELLLTATSQFCLYQGQEMLAVLFEAERDAQNGDGLVPVARLRTIATEMRNAGETLREFAKPDDASKWSKSRRVDMRRLVERVWSANVSRRFRLGGHEVLLLEGDCSANDLEERAEKGVSQILSWMGRRLLRFGEIDEREIIVTFTPPNGRTTVKVIFEERRSRRLSPHLRRTFFEPFYAQGAATATSDLADSDRRLGLYLAQALAQIAGGDLSDCSDEMNGPLGHRLVLELPAAVNA
ncbi:MAG: response regulator [Acidobacteria bacterium]|nr:response regulator [Acidobacteriota bacterium]